MPAVLPDTGEEYIFDKLDGESLTVVLYNDSSNGIGDTDDYDAITTEPTGSDYAPQSSAFTSTVVSGEQTLENASGLEWQVGDASETVDAFAVIVNYQSDRTGEGSASDHLLFTGLLTESRDLSQNTTFTLDAGDVALSFAAE